MHYILALLLLFITTVRTYVLHPSSGINNRTPMSLGVWNKIDVGGGRDGRGVKGKDEESSYFSSTPWSSYLPSLALYNTFTTQTDPYISSSIQSSLSTLSSAYRLYGPDNVVGSYNGGKDACVIMHLQRAAHAKWWEGRIKEAIEKGEEPPVPAKPRFVYFENPSEFPSILTLLHTTVSTYDLSMCELSNCGFKDGLSAVIKNTKGGGQMGFVLGTRKGDPNCEGQESFSPSSDWMPPFMRINPVLNWNYGSIWHFLRIFQLEYCELYDEGYTSLGKVGDTRKCESLRKGGVEGEEY